MAVYVLCLIFLVMVIGIVQGQGNGLFFKNHMVNHGLVTMGLIGTTPSNAVQCQTTVADCCTDGDPHTGQWFNPDGDMVHSDDTRSFYQVKGPGHVYLQRNMNGPNGIYRCEIGANGNKEIYYVGLYIRDAGEVRITGQLEFKLLSAMTAATPMFTLICTSKGGPATNVTWTSPAGVSGVESQIVTNMRPAIYSNTLTINGSHPGDYTCNVSNVRNTDPATKTLTVTAASPPTQLRATLNQDSNTITVSWSPPTPTPTGYVIYYQATDGGTDSGNRTVTGGSTAHFDISGRNSASYDIIMVATSDHLPSTVVGPNRTIILPTNISATQDGTTITVFWTPPTTGATPNGFVIYYQTTGDQGNVMVNSGSATQQVITGRQTYLVYTITMVTLSNMLSSTETAKVTAVRPVAYIELNGRVLPNNSLVTLPEIGTTEATSLRCVTARTDCCSGGTTGGGDEDTSEWLDPRGGLAIDINTFTSSRDGEGDPLGYVQLHRSSSSAELPTTNEGIYSCTIPEPEPATNPNIVSFYVGIYNAGRVSGQPRIIGNIMFEQQNCQIAMFTLTCTSTGGPATTVTWTVDGSPVPEDGDHSFSQRVLNTVTGEYSNTLTVTGIKPGDYQCTVSNAGGNDTSPIYTRTANHVHRTYSLSVLVGVAVGSALAIVFLTAVVGAVIIIVYFWKRKRSYTINNTGRSIDMKECSAYGNATVQPSAVSEEENIYEN